MVPSISAAPLILSLKLSDTCLLAPRTTGHPALEMLSLSGCPLIQQLQPLRRCPRLRVLLLVNCARLIDSAVARLSAYPALAVLDVSANPQLTDLRALGTSASLRKVFAAQCGGVGSTELLVPLPGPLAVIVSHNASADPDVGVLDDGMAPWAGDWLNQLKGVPEPMRWLCGEAARPAPDSSRRLRRCPRVHNFARIVAQHGVQ